MQAALVRHLVYPVQEMVRRRPTFAFLGALEQTQWYGPDRLRALQRTKLHELLVHAQRNCAYYRETFAAAAVDPRHDPPFETLRRLPLTTKDLMNRHRERLCWRGAPGGLHRLSTGGSTGNPLTFYVDRRRQAYDKAARIRTHRWFGVEPGDREVYLWGSPLETKGRGRLRAWADALINERLLSAFELSEDNMSRYLTDMERFNPASIFGYPSSLALLCRFAVTRRRRVGLPGLRAVFVTGEALDTRQREVLEAFFAVPVADGYGGRDSGFIAHQCPGGNMHVTDENVVVEVVDDEGDPVPVGEVGEIVVTHLDAYAMPFIRYRTGDVGRLLPDRCSCGRGLSLLGVVRGRKTDHLVAADGTRLHGLSLIYVLREMTSVRRFQIHQAANRSVTVLVVPAAGFGPSDHRRIKIGARQLLGAGIDVSVRTVDGIAGSASGKFRCVISEAAPASTIGDAAGPDADETRPELPVIASGGL